MTENSNIEAGDAPPRLISHVMTADKKVSDKLPLFASNIDWLILLLLLSISGSMYYLHKWDIIGDTRISGYAIRILKEPSEEILFTTVPHNKAFEVKGLTGLAQIEWDRDGRVRIVSSACPCKTCINMGWSNRNSLICVPNGIIVDIKSYKSNVDAVTR